MLVKVLLFIFLIGVCLSSLKKPWVGIISYYLFALLGPQYIWWWQFEGLRASLLVASFTLAGIFLNILKGNYDSSFIKTRTNLWLLLLWLFLTISYYFGPYDAVNIPGCLSPSILFSNTCKMFLFYFCATLEINDTKKARYFFWAYVITTIYLIYWANMQYLTGNWDQFNIGRLMGPRGIDSSSIYEDENLFSMIFVTGVPFIYFAGYEISRKWLRYALWAIIPLGWHAVFLTGSRGGLLGLGVTTLITLLLSKRKMMAVPLLLLIFGFYQWQAGSTMKDRSQLITEYQGDSSAEQRLVAWQGGMRMLFAYPLTGVGLGQFKPALPKFNDKGVELVAHNTLVQYAAESGIGAGLCFLMIAFSFYKNTRLVRSHLNMLEANEKNKMLGNYNDVSAISFSGFIICSLFLSLNTFEIYYYLLIINNCLVTLCLRKKMDDQEYPSRFIR